jgi:hypothetical protein
MVKSNARYFGMTVKFFRPKWRKMTTTASVSKRSRRCRNGHGNVELILVAPNSGMVSKTRVKTGIPFIPGNVGWPR